MLNNLSKRTITFIKRLEDIKRDMRYDSDQCQKLLLGAIYIDGRIEITEFKDESFVTNESNYRTRIFRFSRVSEDFYEDLQIAWDIVFSDGRMELKIIG